MTLRMELLPKFLIRCGLTTEEVAMATEAVTEVTTEAGSDETMVYGPKQQLSQY